MKKFFKQFLFIFGLLALSIWFFLRFIKERPYGEILLTFSLVKILSYALSIILAIFTIFVLINNIFSIITLENKEKSKIVEKFLELSTFVKKMVEEFFDTFFARIILRIPKSEQIFNFFMFFFWKTRNYYRLIVNIFIILPRCIVSLSFFIDVVIYRNFYYFPKLVILLLIPFLLKSLIWFVNKHCSDFCYSMESLLDRKSEPNGSYTFSIRPAALEEYSELAHKIMNNLEYFLRDYDVYTIIMDQIKVMDTSWPEKVIFQIMNSILWIISWIFLIIYML